MSEFEPALQFVLKHEGTQLFEDKATGERSRYGITQKVLVALKYPVQDPALLDHQDLRKIYEGQYWTGLDQISSQLVANKIFDMRVNMGTKQAITLTQAAINSVGGACVIDGLLGPHTIIVINQFLLTTNGEERLLSELVLKCCTFYKQIATGDRAKFLTGWLTRAEDIGTGEIDKAAFSTLRSGDNDKTVKG